VEMLAQPRVPELLGRDLHTIGRAGVRGIGSWAARKCTLRWGSSLDKRCACWKAVDSGTKRALLSQAGVVHLPCGFQASGQDALLGRRHPKGHRTDEGGRPLLPRGLLRGLLLGVLRGLLVSRSAPETHRRLAVEEAGQTFWRSESHSPPANATCALAQAPRER